MKRLLIYLAIATIAVGCNKTTTTGTGVSPRTGETIVKKMTLTAAKDQTIARGAMDKVTVSINRDNFEDPVTITFSNLPQGVEIVEKDMVIDSDSKSLTVTLKADAQAALGEHVVTIAAQAPGLEKNTQMFKLTVK